MITTKLYCAMILGRRPLPSGPSLAAQVQTEVPPAVPGAKPVLVEHIKIHGKALEGNLEGDAVTVTSSSSCRPATPPRRTGVTRRLCAARLLDRRRAVDQRDPCAADHRRRFRPRREGDDRGAARFEDAHNGSMYSSSVTTGDFERFISHDLLHTSTRITGPFPSARAGDWSAIRWAATAPPHRHEAFRRVRQPVHYEPVLPVARAAGPANPDLEKVVEAVKTPADSANLPFFARATGQAAAWSPDPKNPPLYLDLPTKNGVPQPDVLAKWAANAPLAFVDQYIGNLRQYRAIAIDVGDQDGLRGRHRQAA
jgi:hypothetical protein